MNLVIGLILLMLLLSAIRRFARMNPADVARTVRTGGGVLGLIGAGLLLLRGQIFIAAAVAGMAASFAGWRKFGQWASIRWPASATAPGAGRVTTARSAMLEMRLDHDTGGMTGAALSGAFAGRSLDTLSRPELMRLDEELRRDDPDGVALLETYLDRRFAGWRETDEGQGQRRGTGGAMSRREAYETLGLEEGAGPEEIIRAHRALMKKLHPDRGGSTGLAARVNQAKDVLMQQRHG